MPTQRWRRLKALFEKAIRLDKKKRKEFLDKLNKEDPELKKRLEILLVADEDASSSRFMENQF